MCCGTTGTIIVGSSTFFLLACLSWIFSLYLLDPLSRLPLILPLLSTIVFPFSFLYLIALIPPSTCTIYSLFAYHTIEQGTFCIP